MREMDEKEDMRLTYPETNSAPSVGESMVERVAKALAPGWFTTYLRDDVVECLLNNYPGQHLGYQERARKDARAAIAAMREPTESMFIRGDEEIITVLNDHTFALKEPTVAVRCWRAMVDGALAADGAKSDKV